MRQDWAPPVAPQVLRVFKQVMGPDTVVAYSIEDAWAVWAEHCGERREDYDDDTWSVIADDQPFTIQLVEMDASDLPSTVAPFVPATAKIKATATAKAWAEHSGRGFLCSTEW